MTINDDSRPKFYRAIHFPYTERIISRPSKSTAAQSPDPICSTLKQCKKLTNSTKDQYIKLRTPAAGGLPYSAKFRCGDAFWKLHGEGCLVTIGSDYVAQVSIEYIPELDDVSDFDTSKELLLAHLKTDNVLFDQLAKVVTDTVKTIKTLLYELAARSVTDPNSAKCLLELWRIAEKYDFKICVDFSDEINSNDFIQHDQLKAVIEQHMKQSKKQEERSIYQQTKSWFQDLIKTNFFLQSLQTAVDNHKTMILETCTLQLERAVLLLEPTSCLLLRKNDVKLFSDLECTLSEKLFEEALPKIQMNFIKRVTSINPTDYDLSLPLINGVYFHVCKSMSEIAKRVEEELGIQKSLVYENEWQVTRIENGKIPSLYAKCFVKQLQMLVSMANHFEPGKTTVSNKFPYKYQIELFNASKLTHEDLHIWLCLVDATMVDIFEGNTERIMAFSALLEMFFTYVSRSESQESVRMVAHNTLEFVAQVEQSVLGSNAKDTEVLRKQLSFIGPEFLSDNLVFTRYRDLLDVFKNYWERFNEVLPKLTSKLEGDHLEQQVDEIKNLLSKIVYQLMNKNAIAEDVIKFFRAYNDLFTDIEDMPFEWYVRIQDRTKRNRLLRHVIIKRVENGHSYSDNECYQVQHGRYDRFIGYFIVDEPPKHYQVEVLKTLLNNIENIGFKQKWVNGNELSPKDQITATVLLINAVRSSLLYLKEQPDYIDFEKYYEESVKPFSSVIVDSISMQDFTTRVQLIKDSFWYIRNQNSIGIDKALQLFGTQDEFINKDLLTSSYDRYDKQFLKYTVDYSKLNTNDKMKKIVADVRSKVRPMQSTKWTSEFKQTTLPEVLAGLAAVWSIKVSIDVAKSGKALKPHSIQVLSMLRLLNVDGKDTGVAKHLAQILTGQGKSLVLGLVAALLALFDHDVVVMCYSRYLANRDFNDFKDLFHIFSVDTKIFYQTFEDVAWNEMHKLYAKATKYVSSCIGIPGNKQNFKTFASKLNNVVLLIDEVDVFFMDKFYGKSFKPIFLPPVRGLGKVQQQIWKLVQKNNCNVKVEIKSFINSSNDFEVRKLKSLLQRPKRYTLINIDTDVTEVEHTNESLFSTHLQQMIDTAIAINNLKTDHIWICSFRLDSNGNITHKDDHGIFRTSCYYGYHNVFVYFKLRQTNFVQSANGIDNFGYLNLNIAAYSYSKIPEKFPLILGVTGTLNELNTYEKNAIRNHYRIMKSSIMPSFFGSSNLKFDPLTDFKCHQKIIEWKQAIFTRVNAIINAQRSVIVFFDSETEIAQFRQEFQSQLDRLNEITINTEANLRDRYIREAGLSRTVTLATREMGRGVDYKSSLSVEKNGGVHVIQTFFSLDDKEETQIKGRTARKDNRGSYELIVCHPHLFDLKLVRLLNRAESITYQCLLDSREDNTEITSGCMDQNLAMVNDTHQQSIAFCKSI